VANALITPTVIAREALMQLDNNLVVAKTVYRDYDSEYRAVGETINVRRPVDFTVTDGAAVDVQDVEEANFPLAMDKQKHVAWKFSSKDLTLTIEEYSERYIKPAMIQLANQVDRDLLSLANKFNNWVGTAGQDINSFSDFAKGPERLDLLAVPQGMRYAVLSPSDYWAFVSSQTSLNASDKLVESAYEQARLGRVGGVEVLMAQNVQTLTCGTRDNTTPLTAGAQSTTYASAKTNMTMNLNIDGLDASVTIEEGAVFTIDGVYDVNPVTKATLPHLKQFTVMAAKTGEADGTCTLSIYPAIIPSGPYQNVSNAAANDKAIIFYGAASAQLRQNLIYHRNAMALVTAPLYMPDGASFKAQETDSSNGLSVRVIKDYDFNGDFERIRLDILYGVKTLDPRLGARMSGT